MILKNKEAVIILIKFIYKFNPYKNVINLLL